MKRSEVVEKLRKSFIENTNRRGYIEMSTDIASDILSDLEPLLNFDYDEEDQPNNGE